MHRVGLTPQDGEVWQCWCQQWHHGMGEGWKQQPGALIAQPPCCLIRSHRFHWPIHFSLPVGAESGPVLAAGRDIMSPFPAPNRSWKQAHWPWCNPKWQLCQPMESFHLWSCCLLRWQPKMPGNRERPFAVRPTSLFSTPTWSIQLTCKALVCHRCQQYAGGPCRPKMEVQNSWQCDWLTKVSFSWLKRSYHLWLHWPKQPFVVILVAFS